MEGKLPTITGGSDFADAFLRSSALPFAEISRPEEARPQDDPLAAQVWKMYAKQRKELPNGARMENLTWRMVRTLLRISGTDRQQMAMSLRKKELAAQKK